MAYAGRQYDGTLGLNLKARLIFRSQKMRNRLQDLWDDTEVIRELTELFAKSVEPFVPKDTGALRSSVVVMPRKIRYDVGLQKDKDGNITSGGYAHYVYAGIVYEQNIPVFKDGALVRFVSIKGQSKIRSDPKRMMEYHTSGTSDHWDKAMLKDKEAAKKFRTKAGRIVTKEWRKKYG